MGEKFPTQKYQFNGDFTDSAWTAFAEANTVPKVPETVPQTSTERFETSTLAQLIEHPIVASDIPSNPGDFVKFLTVISARLVDAKCDIALVGTSIGNLKFDSDALTIAADINRIISNFNIQLSRSVVQAEAPIAPKIVPIHTGGDQALGAIPVRSLGSTVQMVEVAEAELGLVNPEHVAEYNERKNFSERRVPQFVAPEVAQPVAPVVPSQILETTQRIQNQPTAVKSEGALAMQPPILKTMSGESALALQEIENKEFSPTAYRDLIERLDMQMVGELATVKEKASTQLRRYSDEYVPKPSEKAALKLVPALLAKNARAEVLRAEILNNLHQSEESITIDEIKRTAHHFISAIDDIRTICSELDTLITIAETEPKEPLTEVYRAQFEKLRIDGEKVLAKLVGSHPRYDEFRKLIENDLGELIRATSPEAVGAQGILEGDGALFARRDRIKSAIAYMKAESNYLDFVKRSRVKVNELMQQFEEVTGLPEEQMNLRQEKLDALRTVSSLFNPALLPASTPFIATSADAFDEAVENLSVHKTEILQTINVSKTILESWPKAALQRVETPAPQFVTHEQLTSRLEQTLLAADRGGDMQRMMERAFEYHTREVILRLEALEAKGNATRRIPFRNVGKIAALAALLAVIPMKETQVKNTEQEVLTALISGDLLPRLPAIDGAAIAEFLRKNSPPKVEVVAAALTPQPKVVEVSPRLPTQIVSPTEVVPGVILSEPDEIVSSDTAPELPAFSDKADRVPLGDVAFHKQPAYEVLLAPHLILKGDTLSNICKELPFMKEIHPAFIEKLLLAVSKKLDSDESLRKKLGGMGNTSDLIFENQEIDRNFLTKILMQTAQDNGYWQ